jgi:hypothetical protein
MNAEITKGSQIVIRKSARPYRSNGFVDHSYIIPASEEHATVLKITKTKSGRKAHVRGEDYGFAIMLDALPDFMTVEVAA